MRRCQLRASTFYALMFVLHTNLSLSNVHLGRDAIKTLPIALMQMWTKSLTMVWCLHKSYSKIFDIIRNYLQVCAGKCNSVRLWWSTSLPTCAWFAKAPESINDHLAPIAKAICPSRHTTSSITTYPVMRGWDWVSTQWNLLVLLTTVLFLCAGYSRLKKLMESNKHNNNHEKHEGDNKQIQRTHCK